jgi:hypothetical protein
LLGRENELSPHWVKDHDAGCFHAVQEKDIRFAVNLDPGFVNRLQGNRPKWFLIYSFQDTLDRHAKKQKAKCSVKTAANMFRLLQAILYLACIKIWLVKQDAPFTAHYYY